LNIGIAEKSGEEAEAGWGGKWRVSLKSIELSEGGFHFRLTTKKRKEDEGFDSG